MTPEWLFWIIAFGLAMFVIGFAIGNWRQEPMTPHQIERYLRKQFPNEWRAYKTGVKDGYSQGIRDGGEGPT